MIARIFGAVALSAALALSTGCMSRDATASSGTNTSSGVARNCQPTTDLEVTAAYERDNIGASKIEGSIFNRSLEKDYDDVQLRVDFYDHAGSQISSQMLVVKQDVEAGEAEDFALDFTTPVGAERATWSIVCAEEDRSWF